MNDLIVFAIILFLGASVDVQVFFFGYLISSTPYGTRSVRNKEGQEGFNLYIQSLGVKLSILRYQCARGKIMVIILGNGHGDPSSNPGRDSLYFIWH